MAASSLVERKSIAQLSVRRIRVDVTTSGDVLGLPRKTTTRYFLNRMVDAGSVGDRRSPEKPWQLIMTTKLGMYAGLCVFSVTDVFSEPELPRSLSKQQVMSLIHLHEKHLEEMSSLLADLRRREFRGEERGEHD